VRINTQTTVHAASLMGRVAEWSRICKSKSEDLRPSTEDIMALAGEFTMEIENTALGLKPSSIWELDPKVYKQTDSTSM
jgi:hypothetical protein